MTLGLRNRQRVCPIDLRLFRRILRYVLSHRFKSSECELCFHLVESDEMAKLNEKFLDHVGPTDVITFDHGQPKSALHGEIFICPEVAVSQAKQFRTSWQEEVVRYAIHGLLHLQGYDDLAAPARRKMKREEERLLADVA
ncbi:MAG TPA: rRNA maturation RNase YbeY, partial [Candidatus Binatia bacterium]|nr:rRNA maturation RNase YbeY [Candidatus Binatia bacterium]